MLMTGSVFGVDGGGGGVRGGKCEGGECKVGNLVLHSPVLILLLLSAVRKEGLGEGFMLCWDTMRRE